MRILIALLLSACGLIAQEKYVTLTLPTIQIQRPPGADSAYEDQTNTLTVVNGEILHLVSLVQNPLVGHPELRIEKDGNVGRFSRGPLFGLWAGGTAGVAPLDSLVIAGPAVVKLVGRGGMATFKITPDQYPPDRTVVVPGGPGGANVTMECSTNLVHWTPADNGAYTNLPGVKFFRIKLDRIQP